MFSVWVSSAHASLSSAAHVQRTSVSVCCWRRPCCGLHLRNVPCADHIKFHEPIKSISMKKQATKSWLLIKLLLVGFILATTISASQQALRQQISPVASRITRNHNLDTQEVQSKGEQNFAPKLIHQPQSATVQANKPHTVECAIESAPEAEVKWFKDDQLLGAQPTHLEQQGSELMFFQMNEEDTGEYRCQATNYLGSVSSEPFRLTVHSSVHEAAIRFEPRLAETKADQMVELTCTIPMPGQDSRQNAEVSWRRNGRKLLVEWLDDGEDIANARNRFVGRQVGPSQFSLSILRTQLTDDNSTFTCLYKLQQQHPDQEQPEQPEAGLARESSPVLLRVHQSASYPMQNINLAPPIEGLANAKPPIDHQDVSSNNHTTKLPTNNNSQQEPSKSLQETARALFELAKPMLSIVGVCALVGLIVGLQLIYMRRRGSGGGGGGGGGCCQSNRYMKHHHHQYSSSSSAGGCSAGSGTGGSSSAGSGILERDPVLSSLLGRTLSAPTCVAAAATLAGNSKKYRSYRDHMRKVAAVQEDHTGVVSHTDLVDSYLAQLANGHPAAGLFQQQQLHLPNLYNQSLAAREQARSLLQANEHMRSLSNLNQTNKHLQRAVATNAAHQLNGSHLNLPLSFANFSRPVAGEQHLGSGGGAFWPPPHLKHLAAAQNARVPSFQQQQQQHYDEHSYQLVDCSNPSVSPSTSSSLAGGSSNSAQLRRSSSELTNNNSHHRTAEPSSQRNGNHYSTIETNDDEDPGSEAYEELEQHQRQASASAGRISSFSIPQDQSSSNRQATDNKKAKQHHQPHYPDHPSPYAVSSICNQVPPPVKPSEAMRALHEQFDINQLMMLDETGDTFVNQLLPPPPPPPQALNERPQSSRPSEQPSTKAENQVKPQKRR